MGLLFHELDQGRLRLNLRSEGGVDVARLAQQWGGGGHPCAAGVMMRCTETYDIHRDRILGQVAQSVSEAFPD